MERLQRVSGLGAAVALAIVVLGGCSKGGADVQSATPAPLPEDMPTCSELFVTGKTVERASFGEACRGGGGELSVPRPVTLECADGRVFLWNDYAWGYVDEPMTIVETGVNDDAPVNESMECLERASGGAGAATTATTTTAAEG
jgi:hypothetical protein